MSTGTGPRAFQSIKITGTNCLFLQGEGDSLQRSSCANSTVRTAAPHSELHLPPSSLSVSRPSLLIISPYKGNINHGKPSRRSGTILDVVRCGTAHTGDHSRCVAVAQ